MPNGVTIFRDYIQGKDVLDLGCGHTLYGIGFLVYGARNYLGIDPKLKLDAPKLRRRERFRTELAGNPWTLRQVQAAVPSVRYAACRISDLPAGDRFDVIFMHNVTEHLMAIEEVFAGLRERLRPEGKIIYRHHNYACWNGHHQKPRTTAEIDPEDPAQAPYLDWAHLDFDLELHPPMGRRLNRIRLHELRALTGRFFKSSAGRSSARDRNREPSGSARRSWQSILSIRERNFDPGSHVRCPRPS